MLSCYQTNERARGVIIRAEIIVSIRNKRKSAVVPRVFDFRNDESRNVQIGALAIPKSRYYTRQHTLNTKDNTYGVHKYIFIYNPYKKIVRHLFTTTST